MTIEIIVPEDQRLVFHMKEVLGDKRRFENAAQSVSRMILERGVDKITKAGRTVYDFKFFRDDKEHIIGWFDEINALVNFVEEAARGASSSKMAFVLIGEPGNGKTFFVDYICDRYRRFLARPKNMRYTFDFIALDKLGKYGTIHVAQSQTLEDPMILAMNLFASQDECKENMLKLRFDDKKIEQLYRNYRPLGACTDYILSDIRDFCSGDIEKMLEFVRVVPVRIAPNSGMVTGKYSAGDKITSSSVELRGKRSLTRVMNLPDTNNPYKYDLREGALARAAGGGIHHADEFFRIKPDLVLIYHQVIQNRTIEMDGYRWPIDTLILCTSNNDAYNEFVSETKEAPIKDRCKPCFVSHNTDYKLQQELTRYAIGTEKKKTIMGEDLHEDPNLDYTLSIIVALTRLPRTEQLSPMETMKLEAGENAGEKSVKTLAEIKKNLNKSQDVTMRWGQKGVGHRGLGRIIQGIVALPETHEGKCMFAGDAFDVAESEINDSVSEAANREKFLKDLQIARKLYKQHIRTSIFNAYMDDPDAIRKSVMAYVNMIIGIESDQLGPEKMWRPKDPQNPGKFLTVKIDEKYIEAIEDRLGKKTKETREAFRTNIRKIYGQKMATEPNYDFMDNEDLVEAVTEVRLDSDVAGAGSLIGALTNPTNEENMRIKNRMIDTMHAKLNYCNTCAVKTIEEYCKPTDR